MKPVLALIQRRLNPLAAIVDQAWLSLVSLAVAIAFIQDGSKEEYGFYLLMLAPLLLVQSVQNAVVNSPLATFLPIAAENERPLLQQTAAGLHLALALTAAVLGVAGLFVYLHWSGQAIGVGLISGFAAAVLGTVAREAQRSFAYVRGEGARALKGDLIYGIAMVIGIAWAVMGQQLTAAVVLWFTGLAGVLPLIFRLHHYHDVRLASEQLNQLWTCGRWALPSVLVTWLNLSAYPFFAENALGLHAVADIGASRLFLMPVGLVITAWSNWFRPRISRWFGSGDIKKIRKLSLVSSIAGVGCITVVGLLLVFGYPHIENLLGSAYRGLLTLILMWVLYFCLSWCRTVFMATLMIDAAGYRTLHHMSWLALILSLPGFLIAAPLGSGWVVGVLCVTELFQLGVTTSKAISYWKNGEARS